MPALISSLNTPMSSPSVPVWSWAIGPSSGSAPSWELATITNRSLKVTLNDISTATYTINGDSVDATHIGPLDPGQPMDLATDTWVSRDGIPLFRGRITGTADDIQASNYTVGMTSSSYEALLDRRLFLLLGAPQTHQDAVGNMVFAGTDQSVIVQALLDYAAGQTNGDMGIRTAPGWSTTGVLRNITFSVGTSVWAAIKSMISMSNGFDWFLDTNLVASIVAGHAGINKGALLSYGGNVSAASGVTEAGTYMNGIYMSGGTITNSSFVPQPISQSVSDIQYRPEGRWETAISDPVLTDSASVQSATNYYLTRYGDRLQTAWSITMTPGAWGGPGHIWVNDIVNLSIHRGRLAIDLGLRVYELDIAVDQSGIETVTCTLGTVNNDDRSVIKALAKKLSALAKQ
jgi:hypothetical protein